MRKALLVTALLAPAGSLAAASQPVRAPHAMVVSQNAIASGIGRDVLSDGGTAVDAAVAVAFALAVTHPKAGNLGGGGFLLLRKSDGEAAFYDFREKAPARSSPTMFLLDGKYSEGRHHESAVSVGVPGTVAGLHRAWSENGRLPWRRLVEPAVALARDGFPVTVGLARSLNERRSDFARSRAALAQFTKDGAPYEAGDVLRQPDLARTLERIAASGPAGFYAGETADLIAREMERDGGLITREDLAAYRAERRAPLRGTYRGFEVLSAPPPSSGGTVIVEALNVLEGFDLAKSGAGSAETVHLVTETLRRAFADRAHWLGDPEANPGMPVDRLTSKEYAAAVRRSISRTRAARSSPSRFTFSKESAETTHFSVVDAEGSAASMTYTLEDNYGSKIVVEGGGFLLNNEMGDFNAAPGMTDSLGHVGTAPNLAAPGKRMLSSMSPTIVAKAGRLALVTGSPGGRTIISTTLQTVLDVLDFGLNAREAVDAPRFHHQWLPDQLEYESVGFSPDTLKLLAARGHTLCREDAQGIAQVIAVESDGTLAGASDTRDPDGGAAGY